MKRILIGIFAVMFLLPVLALAEAPQGEAGSRGNPFGDGRRTNYERPNNNTSRQNPSANPSTGRTGGNTTQNTPRPADRGN
jgi:hypothetical protein